MTDKVAKCSIDRRLPLCCYRMTLYMRDAKNDDLCTTTITLINDEDIEAHMKYR